MKVALVYDRINKWGGAERVLLAMHQLWPEAPLFTAVYDPERAKWAKVFQIQTSWLQHFPLAKRHHEFYPWLTPMAFQSFNFDNYDLVISVTSAEAKNLITKPKTLHICYCLTPTRYLWSGYQDYQNQPGMDIFSPVANLLQRKLTPTLRRWDLYASSLPDYYLAISQRVAERIRLYYQREVEAVIYPPVNTNTFTLPKQPTKSDYFLVVSRLVGYKRIDLIIETFNELGWPLVIIGSGWQKKELQNKAKKNINFLDGNLTEKDMVRYYQNCRALIQVGVEDFGLTAVEAQACGKPVIGFSQSGVSEIIKEGLHGLLFVSQSKQALKQALLKFSQRQFAKMICRENALRFSLTKFQQEMKDTVEILYRRWQKL